MITPAAMPLTLSELRTDADLTRERVEWEAFLRHAPARSLSLTWHWLHTWWKVYGTDDIDLRVLLLRADSQLVGIAPFIVQRERGLGGISLRVLRFLGTGEPEREDIASEYLDIVTLSGYEAAVAQAVWDWMRSPSAEWDMGRFDDLLETSCLLQSLIPLAQTSGCFVRVKWVGTRYRVDLPGEWDEYVEQLPGGSAKRMLYARRRLERDFKRTQFSVAAPAEAEATFAELERLHGDRWASRGKSGGFSGERFREFHRRLIADLLPKDQVRLYQLRAGGATIAALYNFRFDKTEYFYQTGFDVAVAKYSPGQVAISQAIEQAIADKLEWFDFMKGQDRSYKSAFGCSESPMFDMQIVASSPRGRLLAWAARVKGWLFPGRIAARRQGGIEARSEAPRSLTAFFKLRLRGGGCRVVTEDIA